jgi:hypothetical protein
MHVHNPALPRELERSAPRDVRLTTSGLALTVLAWVLAAASVFAGAFLYVEAWRQSNAASAMEQRGVATRATVDRLWRKNDDKPAYAAFHFDAGVERINGQSRMNLRAWQALRVGTTLGVRYLPEDPRKWTVDGARQRELPFWLAYVVAAVLGLAVAACSAAIRWQRTLLREGRPATAVVTGVSKHSGRHGATHVVIKYQFPLLGGGTQNGKASVSKGMSVGATITVLYDPDHAARNRPYPFPLVFANRET